jgi:hypothetical protein
MAYMPTEIVINHNLNINNLHTCRIFPFLTFRYVAKVHITDKDLLYNTNRPTNQPTNQPPLRSHHPTNQPTNQLTNSFPSPRQHHQRRQQSTTETTDDDHCDNDDDNGSECPPPPGCRDDRRRESDYQELYTLVLSTFDLGGIASDGHDPDHPIAAQRRTRAPFNIHPHLRYCVPYPPSQRSRPPTPSPPPASFAATRTLPRYLSAGGIRPRTPRRHRRRRDAPQPTPPPSRDDDPVPRHRVAECRDRRRRSQRAPHGRECFCQGGRPAETVAVTIVIGCRG